MAPYRPDGLILALTIMVGFTILTCIGIVEATPESYYLQQAEASAAR